MSCQLQRERLVGSELRKLGIQDEAVLRAMLEVPREQFVLRVVFGPLFATQAMVYARIFVRRYPMVKGKSHVDRNRPITSSRPDC